MIFNNPLRVKILGAFIGTLIGFSYWYFVGCEDDCSIQSVWWRMSLWGSIMGYLISSIILEYILKQTDFE